MAAAIGFGAVFYVCCIAVQTLGFGTDAGSIRASPPRPLRWATSPAPT